MKPKHKYLNPIGAFMVVYLFGYFLFNLSKTIVSSIYSYLNYLFPETFKVYNVIYHPDQYAKLEKTLSLVSIFVVLFLINYIALRLENKKYERIISLTEGQYLLKDGITLYFKEFFISDIITSSIIPGVLVIPAFFISDKLMEYFGLIIFNWLGHSVECYFSIIPAILIAAIFSFIGRMLAIPLIVKSWRAAWLSDI